MSYRKRVDSVKAILRKRLQRSNKKASEVSFHVGYPWSDWDIRDPVEIMSSQSVSKRKAWEYIEVALHELQKEEGT